MRCMKCGGEAPDNRVFCDSCLETMEHYPVKPGTPILLPPKQAKGMEKHAASQKDRESTPAEQLRQLRGMVRWLTAIIALLSVLLCGTAVMLLRTLERSAPTAPSIGKNYTTTGTQGQP